MKKSELIGLVAKHYPQSVAQDVKMAVNTILNAPCEERTNGEHFEIRGLGSYGLNYQLPRNRRNPKSGKAVKVLLKCVQHLKSVKELRMRVNGK